MGMIKGRVYMNAEIIKGILIPFAGTSAGAACVFFMKYKINDTVQRILTGFAAGIMTAASIWSLLLPALEQSAEMGRLAFIPVQRDFSSEYSFC